MEHNQQGSGQGRGRRGHFHRGRRPDRRGPSSPEPRQAQTAEPAGPRPEHVDVEQIMRDIRSRIAQRHGIDLSAAQIHELAARRLEAILDPRNVNSTLLEQLRLAAGARPARDLVAPPAEPPYTFEDTTLYETHRGLLRFIRRLLNPILKLFFNPNPVVHALNAQARLNAEQAARESERDQQQAEWNALHFELVRRVVTESARLSLEVQALALRVESLTARVDFADRRVRAVEAGPAPRQPAARPAAEAPASAPPGDNTPAAGPESATGGEGQRRRRRRRRGRRSGPFGEGPTAPGAVAASEGDLAGDDDGDELADDTMPAEAADSGEAAASSPGMIETAPEAGETTPRTAVASPPDDAASSHPAPAGPPEADEAPDPTPTPDPRP